MILGTKNDLTSEDDTEKDAVEQFNGFAPFQGNLTPKAHIHIATHSRTHTRTLWHRCKSQVGRCVSV